MNYNKLIDISVNKDMYNVGIVKENNFCLNFISALRKGKETGDNKK